MRRVCDIYFPPFVTRTKGIPSVDFVEIRANLDWNVKKSDQLKRILGIRIRSLDKIAELSGENIDFTKSERNNCTFFFLDVVFSVAVTGSLVVFVWRGVWVFLDRRLFPESPTHSAWGSLVIGVTVSVLAFFTQIVMSYCLRKNKKGFWKTAIEDVFYIFSFIGSVNIWRGVWNLLNIYLYPGNYKLSNMVTTIGGNLILMIFFCANSTIPLLDAEMDGSKEGAKGIAFNISYLRSFYKYNRKKPAIHYGNQNKKKRLSAEASGFIDISKSNGLMDSRGRGDGNSYSDSYSSESDNDKECNL